MPFPAIVFDVNETLLDLSALDPLFADAFGDKATRRMWFSQTLQNAMSATIVGSYTNFGEIAAAALDMTARRRGVTIDAERRRRILHGMRALPPHGDVIAGLERLRGAGYRLAVLTNSAPDVAHEQLEHAKLAGYFEKVLSADAVRRFKPAPETYAHAVRELDTTAAEVILVAAHEWDVAGAMHAGLQAAFDSRHGTALNPLEPTPAIVAPTIRAVADAIVARGNAA